MAIRRIIRGTDWSRAKHRMPASFADQPRRDEPVQGRHEDGLDLVEAVAGATALATTAQLAGDEPEVPVRDDAVGLGEEDVLPAESERAAEQDPTEVEEEED